MEGPPELKRMRLSLPPRGNDDETDLERAISMEPPVANRNSSLFPGPVSFAPMLMEFEALQPNHTNTYNETKDKDSRQLTTKPTGSGDGDGDAGSSSTFTGANYGAADRLCEDELFVIFGNSCILTEDLLNFRLVNRSWRDAATLVLTQRNACELILTLKKINSAEMVTSSKSAGESHSTKVYCNARSEQPKESLLSDLNDLISASPKFPATRLRFLNQFAFGSSTSHESHDDEYVEDLIDFFALYGSKIKSLCLGNRISKKELRDVLTIHTPNLDALDLSCLISFRHTSLHPTDETIWKTPLEDSLRTRIETIRLGPCFIRSRDLDGPRAVSEMLQNVYCNSIEDIRYYLYVIVDPQFDETTESSKKIRRNLVPLVKDLKYVPCEIFYTLFREFAKNQPKLCRLSVILNNMSNIPQLYYGLVKHLNGILKSSQNTLEYFEITLNPHDFLRGIKFRPMKNLRCVKLIETDAHFYQQQQQQPNGPQNIPQIHEQMPIFRFLIRKNSRETDLGVFFPKLRQVSLDVYNFEVQNKLMGFFSYNNKNSNAALSDQAHDHGQHQRKFRKKYHYCGVNVTHLELCGDLRWPSVRTAGLMSSVFQGLTCVKISCQQALVLSSSPALWVLCRTVNYIEIHSVSNRTPKKVYSAVDSFFTGFPKQLCAQLQSGGPGFGETIGMTDANVDSFRINPSMCSLKNLKVFKIQFKELLYPFASKVSGMYAFQKMQETRIIFSYDAFSMTASEIKRMDKNLASVAPYVQILKEKTRAAVSLERCYHCGNEWL